MDQLMGLDFRLDVTNSRQHMAATTSSHTQKRCPLVSAHKASVILHGTQPAS